MRLLASAAMALALAASPAPAALAEPAPAPRAPLTLSLPIQRVTLENGLRVVLSPEPGAARVGVVVSYGVGSRHEERGRTGFAHLFEHLMMMGGKSVEPRSLPRLIMSRGGNTGAGTGADLTHYYSVAPAGELPLVLWLEADRMRALDISEENLKRERQVVQEEVRGRYNDAYSVGLHRLDEMVFQGYWPYEHSTGGALEDIEAAQLSWVRAFHAAHYGPNNAVLSISGGFDPGEALALIRRYFGGIPAIPLQKAADPPMPEQKAPRAEVAHDEFARTPGVFYGIAGPRWLDPEHPALELALLVLGDGESSRLHRRLVKEKALAQEAGASWDVMCTGPHLLTVEAKLALGASMPEVKRIIEEELDRLGKEPISAAELDGARRKAQLNRVSSVEDAMGRAIMIGVYELFFGDARLINAEPSRYQPLTAEDVRRAAAKYLAPARRSVIEIQPKGAVKP